MEMIRFTDFYKLESSFLSIGKTGVITIPKSIIKKENIKPTSYASLFYSKEQPAIGIKFENEKGHTVKVSFSDNKYRVCVKRLLDTMGKKIEKSKHFTYKMHDNMLIIQL